MDILAQAVLTFFFFFFFFYLFIFCLFVCLQVYVNCTGRQWAHMEVFLVLEKCMSFNIISSPEPKAHRLVSK